MNFKERVITEWPTGMSADIVLGWECSQNFIFSLEASLLGQGFIVGQSISRRNYQPSADIQAAWRGLFAYFGKQIVFSLFAFSRTLLLRLWSIQRCYGATDKMVSYLCFSLFRESRFLEAQVSFQFLTCQTFISYSVSPLLMSFIVYLAQRWALDHNFFFFLFKGTLWELKKLLNSLTSYPFPQAKTKLAFWKSFQTT